MRSTLKFLQRSTPKNARVFSPEAAATSHIKQNIAYRKAPAELNRTLDDIIIPQWWADSSPFLAPATYQVDCGGSLTAEDLQLGSSLSQSVQAMYDEVGIVHVVNTGLSEFSDMRKIAKMAMQNEMKYEAGANPRDSLADNVFEVGAPLSAFLHYHHEMTYVGQSTLSLAFMCRQTVPGRGSTFFSHGNSTTDYILSTPLGQKLKEKGVCYHRNLTDRDYIESIGNEEGVYNHWQKSFGTEDPAEAEAIAQRKGLRTSWGDNRYLMTRYYADAFEYCPLMDRNVLYSSLADHGMWFDQWPLIMHLPYEQRPLHMTFGDDTEFSLEERQEFVAAYDKFGMQVDWKPGDVTIFCNYRYAHGRPAINLEEGENRELGVILGQTFDRVGQRNDKWSQSDVHWGKCLL
jgi:hypothetical protein